MAQLRVQQELSGRWKDALEVSIGGQSPTLVGQHIPQTHAVPNNPPTRSLLNQPTGLHVYTNTGSGPLSTKIAAEFTLPREGRTRQRAGRASTAALYWVALVGRQAYQWDASHGRFGAMAMTSCRFASQVGGANLGYPT